MDNLRFKVKIEGKEHDLFVQPSNLAALGAGATIYLNGKLYKPKMTVYLLPTESNCYMDQVPLLELELVS